MKKAFLLLALAALSFSACQKTPATPEIHKDDELTGEKIEIPASIDARKIFVLNEGNMGSNNASMDFIRVSNQTYVKGAFRKMNPGIGAGLGDVGNDIKVLGNEVWIIVSNSGIVEVISAKDETEIAAIRVPNPRNIAFDKNYAYVTSWAGAFIKYGEDHSVKDSKNPKGQLYRINLRTKKLEGSVEVGFQPEGVIVQDGKIYVANSGGISSQLPPDYSYDKRVSVIDASNFKTTKTIDVQINLKSIYSGGAGLIFVTSLGNYGDTHSGLYCINTGEGDKVSKISDYVSVSDGRDGQIYWIGTEQEFEWKAKKEYKAWSYANGTKKEISLNLGTTSPYSLAALGNGVFLIGDAKDYFNPGTVSLFVDGNNKKIVEAGIIPGHFAIW